MSADGPPGDGWRSWQWDAPPDTDDLREIWRAQWGNETYFVRSSQMQPYVNVAGLYWRPA